ncbi:MAG: LysM peptidoglycan-binding domain-containing protein [Clostridiales bacterium]|nr:LysM peptidoglycan-binding domain-containing protein [Clostridiales bacterium]
MRSRREAVRNERFILFIIGLSIFFIIICSVIFGSVRTVAASADTPYKYYTSIQLQTGDTLWDIAHTYCTPEYESISDYIEEVCTINHISAGDEIHSGQYITVPYYSHDYLE